MILSALMGKRRKTRQEKIITQLRRRLEITPQAKRETGNEKPFDIKLETVKLPDNEVQKPPSSSPAVHLSPLPSVALIKKDLTKTVALAALAISLEIVLFFLLG